MEGFDEEEDDEVIDDDELYDDDDEDDFEDDDDEDDDDEDDEDDDDDEDEEELSGGVDVEAIYEEADLLLDEFQDYLKDRVSPVKIAPAMMKHCKSLSTTISRPMRWESSPILTSMRSTHICGEFLLERERISKRKFAETKQALAHFLYLPL